jgi:shikimate dehydrogenase
MKKYAVIGNPVHHSISPMIHAQFSEELGLEISYEKILSPINGFQDTVKKFIDSNGQGFNITLPFKIQAHNLSKNLTLNARAAGAVNAIKIEDDTLIGENTDGNGLVNDFTNNLNQSFKGKEILIIGAGGATQGILKPILDCNPEKILLANRTKEKSLKLASKFLQYGKVCGFGLDQIKAKPVDIVINATSASIDGNIPNIPKGVVEGALCYDLMYGKETPFMKWANENSARKVSDGLGMLVEQAALSFSFWLEKNPQTKPVIELVRAKGE